MDEIKEITIDQAEEPKKDLNPLKYVTITVKEYRKLISKIARYEVEREMAEKVAKESEYAEKYREWWHKEQNETAKLKEALEDAKSQLRELLGVEELKEEE